MKYLVSVLVVIIFILTAFVAYFVGKQNILIPTSSPTLSVSNSPAPISSPAPQFYFAQSFQ